MPQSRGFRRKTRSLFKSSRHAKGLSNILTEYHLNDRVVITIDPAQVKGMPHRRFHGKVGTVAEIRPRSLLINVPTGNKVKKIIARLEHVKPLSCAQKMEI